MVFVPLKNDTMPETQMSPPVPGRLVEPGRLHLAFLAACLLISVLSGRQLHLDGANYVVQSLLDPLWYPHPTPRRLFAILWSTWPVRLVGLASPDLIALGSFVFGLTSYTLILIPVALVLKARMPASQQAVILIGFLASMVFLTNFIVTELVFALSMTTAFVTLTLDPSLDPRGRWRLLLAVLLLASYETVALTNPLLALGALVRGRSEQLRSRANRVLVPLILFCATPFQIGFFLVNPWPHPGGAKAHFVWMIAGVFTAGLLVLLGVTRLLLTAGWSAAILVLLCFLVPVSMLLLPSMLGLRSRAFRYAYPSRYFSVGVLFVISLLPLLLLPRFDWPHRVMAWIGTPTLHGLAAAVIAGFGGISVMSSADAVAFRKTFEVELGRLGGMMSHAQCSVCAAPEDQGHVDVGYNWIWPLYSMAYTMRHQDRPPVILVGPRGIAGDISEATVVRFLERQKAQRRFKSKT